MTLYELCLILGAAAWGASISGCIAVAIGKRRSVVAWAILGILFGVLAMIAVALVPPAATPTKKKRRPTQEYYRWRDEDPTEAEAAEWLTKD